jgi:GTP cyclohydrolase I
VTSKLGGVFKNDPSVRNEFMNIVNTCKRAWYELSWPC